MAASLRCWASHTDEDGALKLTIQKFYRVAGGSTQLHGVASDIVLPSLSDLPEFGEGALKNALPYDEVTKAKYTKWSDNHSLFIDQLRRRSEERVKNDPEFHYVMEDMNRLRHKIDENRISLNEDARKKELADDKLRKETRSKERLARNQEEPSIYRVTLDTVDKPDLQLIMYPGKLAEAKKNGIVPKVDSDAAPDADSDLPDSATATAIATTRILKSIQSATRRLIFWLILSSFRTGPRPPAPPPTAKRR